jgi:hypothetical protein
LEASNVHDVPDVRDVPNIIDVTNILDISNVPDATYISDDSCDLTPTFDISQVTTSKEVLAIHHNADMEYDENGPVLLSSSSSPFPIRPSCKPPYPKQW